MWPWAPLAVLNDEGEAVRPGMIRRGVAEGPRPKDAKEDQQTEASDAEFLRCTFEGFRQRTARRQMSDDTQRKYSDEEDLGYIFESWHQKTANRRIADDEKTGRNDARRLPDIRRSHRPPATKRRNTSDDKPIAKRLAESATVVSSREKATTVASSHEEASTPSTTKRPTMSENDRAVAAPQLAGVRVPIGDLWCVCSRDARLAVETVVLHVQRRVEIRLAQGKPDCFKINITSDPEVRFHHRFGYISEGHAFMEVLWRSTPANCVAVETICVDYYIDVAGCRNLTRGGGGSNAQRHGSQQHMYAVFAPISFLAKFRRERVSRALLRVGGTDAPAE